ncbi:MAG TPA: hypothetical protein VM536_23695, partial [Chloroflexia bacterium]|nr:hypothetical protein [Chloroflexia bacterium]
GLLARAAVGLARVLRRSPRVLVPAALGGAIVVLLAPQVPALLAQEARWNAATVMSAAVLADTRAAVPVPVRHQAFIYVNLPTEWEGVPVFRNGLQEAVQLQYGRDPTLRAGIMTCPQVREAHPIAPDSIFQFMAPGVRLIPDADACR